MILEAITKLVFLMDSATPPSSSDPPERDREVLKVAENVEGPKVLLDVELKKSETSWVSIEKDKRVLKKYDVAVESRDGENKVRFRTRSFQIQLLSGKNF